VVAGCLDADCECSTALWAVNRAALAGGVHVDGRVAHISVLAEGCDFSTILAGSGVRDSGRMHEVKTEELLSYYSAG
jgi:hypothetical protein